MWSLQKTISVEESFDETKKLNEALKSSFHVIIVQKGFLLFSKSSLNSHQHSYHSTSVMDNNLNTVAIYVTNTFPVKAHYTFCNEHVQFRTLQAGGRKIKQGCAATR